ncbi:2'-5' RNA ligase family protein [archaeon]|nr:2'-5' RNA ligase family protein [archaeon]MBL7057118.1 2'-5' RNA ligase family protein [Candidatus Woesearchaeota archaeon]
MKIAIDIALLLPDEINSLCIGLNQQDKNAFFDLTKKDNHPHITLTMAVIDEADIHKIEVILRNVAEKFSGLQLELTELNYTITPEDKKSYQFVIGSSKEIKELRQKIVKELSPYFSYEVEDSMFFVDNDEEFRPVSKYWVANHEKRNLSLDKFKPHISLKNTAATFDEFPIKFTTNKLVMAQLGNYCTCRKILIDIDL